MTEAELIARYIEPNPYSPGLAEARIVGYAIPVWALIGYLLAVRGDVAQAASDYHVPQEVVEAAVAYYRLHQGLVDARLEANAS